MRVLLAEDGARIADVVENGLRGEVGVAGYPRQGAALAKWGDASVPPWLSISV